ncbi:MAG: hypothetical protein CL840_08825 [Crocinitomicaceae bacterium]|nr:hypothetical protein [Crocinitomicaceae bacterium]|tara:strand:- start:59787 stop:60713 length:927 start_codon:yes stop_codon:yes gene_type:complete
MTNLFRLAVISTLFILILQTSIAQIGGKGVNTDEFKNFLKTTTTVVLTGNEEFDNALKAALSENWTITPIEYSSYSDFEESKMIQDGSKSFMSFVNLLNTTHYNTITTEHRYIFIGVYMGGKESIKEYKFADCITQYLLDHWGNEKNFEDITYKLPTVIKMMEKTVLDVKKYNIEGGNTRAIMGGLGPKFNGKKSIVREKTLLIPRSYVLTDDFKKPTYRSVEDNMRFKAAYEKDIIKNYPYKYEICDQERIKTALGSNEEGVLVLCLTRSTNKLVYIYDPSASEIVYYDFSVQGLAMTGKDYKLIAK